MNSKDSSILINGHQLREALSFLAPDDTDEQLDQEVIISTGGAECHSGSGLYCWLDEYPEEGAIKLDGTSPAVLSAPPASEQLTDAARDVLAERRRQVEDEQWTPEHDDRYRHRQLAMAAACYAAAVPVHDVLDGSDGRIERRAPAVSRAWPWAKAWWKPGTARQNLVKAGALILAEIERLDRATATGLPEGRPSEAEESQP